MKYWPLVPVSYGDLCGQAALLLLVTKLFYSGKDMPSLSHFREAPGRETVSKRSMDSVVFDIMLHTAKLASGLSQQPVSSL